MSFPFNIYLLAALGGILTTVITLPLWRAVCLRVGLVDDPGPRKIHETRVPLAGGIAILSGILLPLLAGLVLTNLDFFGLLNTESVSKLAWGFDRRTHQLTAILLGAAAMTLLGSLDDRFELWPALKLAGQVLVAALVAAAGIRITLFVSNPLFSYAITILWIVTVTNAVNFMDNMNGLCAGLGSIAALSIGVAAARDSHYLVAATAFLVSGAILGFLPYNFPRATAFLGDAGSHLIGFLLAVLSILPHFYSAQHPRPLAVISPLLLLAVPLGDLAWVVILRLRLRQPFYVGDTNHLSHRLVRRGWNRTRAVLAIWIVAALIGALIFLL